MKVLEIGAGTGWNAALIGHIVGSNGQVTSIDIQSDVTRRARKHIKKLGAKNVEIITCDGMQGWKIQSPYNRIVTTVNSPDISPHWINQLKTNGRMLVSLHDVVGEGRGLLVRLKKAKNHLHGEVVGLAGFLIMDGEYGQSFTPREEKIQEASQGRRAQRKVPVWKNWPKEVSRGRVRDLLFYAQLEGLSVESGGNYRRGTAIVRKPGDESACVVETDDINV